MKPGLWFAMLLVCNALGCSGTQPVQTQVMLNYQNCQTLEAGITQVSLERIAQIRGSRLLSLEVDQQPESPVPELSAAVAIYAISKGPMPTPGYAMALQGTELLGQTMTVNVDWSEPAADVVQAQVVTHPCLVIALPVTEATRLVANVGGAELAALTLTP